MVPARPSRLAARDIHRDAVTLEWEPPQFDGGANITGYLIEKRDARKQRWTYVHKVEPEVQEYTVPGLVSGHDYFFRIRPMNRIGLGDPIQQETPIMVQSPYSRCHYSDDLDLTPLGILTPPFLPILISL